MQSVHDGPNAGNPLPLFATRAPSPGLSSESDPITRLAVQLVDGTKKTFSGRDAWALGQLIDCGERGVTPIERPAPRWAHYCFKLRRAGVNIETIEERHGGAFSGTHARYVLRTLLRVVEVARQSDKRGPK